MVKYLYDKNIFLNALNFIDINKRYFGVLEGTTCVYELSNEFHIACTKHKSRYFSEDMVSELKFLGRLGYIPKPNFMIKDIWEQFRVNFIVFVLTNECNLACSYCYALKGSYGKEISYMSKETALKTIDFLSKLGVTNPTLGFYGGEPLLNYSVLVEVVKYVVKRFDRCRFAIFTNGTLINENIASFLKKYKFEVQVSIDGTAEIHNRFRKYPSGRGSYEDVKRGIGILSKKEVRFNLRATLNDVNFELDSVKNILAKFSPCNLYVKYNTKHYSPEFRGDILTDLCKRVERYREDGDFITKVAELGSLINCLLLHREAPRCIAGDAMLVVDNNGDIYPCNTAILSGNKFRIGSISDSDFCRKYRIFKKRFLNLDKCKGCSMVSFCQGGCHIARLDKPEIYKQVACKQKQEIIKIAIKVSRDLKLEQVLKSIKLNYPAGEIEKFKKCWNFHSFIKRDLKHIRPLFVIPINEK